MKSVSEKEFQALYRDTVKEVFGYWTPEMQAEIASHCHGWSPGLFDFKVYLEASWRRFHRAYRTLAALPGGKLCDIGGFWGVFPITMKALGFQVTMTESLKYFSGSFAPLFDCIRAKGVVIKDYDPFEPGASFPEKFDFVTVMAVLEHYPHSLKDFMTNTRALLQPGGKIYLEVPNLAYWPKRTAFLQGNSPLAPLGDIFRSKVPFIGHHHEFTLKELNDLAQLSGLRILSLESYNYSPEMEPDLNMFLHKPTWYLAFRLLKDSRECLAALCEPEGRDG